MRPLLLINAVGLTSRFLPFAPRLGALAESGWCVPLREVLPAVTCTAQATMLTGQPPCVHGIVANGWLYRETGEVRFWQQSNRLMQAEPFYQTAKRKSPGLKVAKLFWWFNQGAAVDFSVTPKPHYGIDGLKIFDIQSSPPELAGRLKRDLGDFPFPSFWGPRAGLPSTQWIAAAAACVLLEDRPDVTLVYLPHLDYDPQRFGPSGTDMAKCVRELDDATVPLLEAARAVGVRVWVVSEYGHCDVSRPVYVNRALREAGLLEVRAGPFGEQLDTFASRAFAVCDHQIAHVYVQDPAYVSRAREVFDVLPGVGSVHAGTKRADIGLEHSRAGEIVLLSEPDAWFAYPFWADDGIAPDYARTVAIHNKPGFDPCELFVDPAIRFPMTRVVRKLIQKKLGFRMTMDVVPLDASIVKGSHGLVAANDFDRPIWIGDGPKPVSPSPMGAIRDAVLGAVGEK
jgi:predicted AlkP superfamily pyrophosphatase or phosphodiesterase